MERLCLYRSSHHGNSSISDDDDDDDNQPCYYDFASLSLSSIFLYGSVIIFCYLRLCSDKPDGGDGGGDGLESAAATAGKAKTQRRVRPQRHPLHSLVWSLLLLQLLVSLAHAGEALLLLWRQGAALPVTLAEAAARLATAALAAAYFDAVEARGAVVCAPLLLQSLGLAAVDGLRALALTQRGFGLRHLRLATAVASAAIASGLFVLFAYGMAHRVFLERRHHGAQRRRREDDVIESAYEYDDASLVSRLTFWWMLPLLRRGYRRPLEMEDMLKPPAGEKAKAQHARLKHMVSKDGSGGVAEKGILTACLQLNWGLVLAGGAFRLLADVFGFAGALSIKLIVDGLARDVVEEPFPQSTANRTEQLSYHALTIEEFFADSYVITVGIFVAALFQGSFSQTSSHLMALAGTRAKNALHVLLYEKALRLPVGSGQQHGSAAAATSSADDSCSGALPKTCGASAPDAPSDDDEGSANEGNIDLGLVMNLASEDILNVREFVWNVHYVWALPAKVLVLVALLHAQLGVSGACAVVLGCALIVPLQLFTGKLMSDNNKRVFAAQDARMAKSAEAVQGMKSVKLGCLEAVVLARVEEARERELRFLRRDSFFWSVMAFLASVSTVVVTAAAVGLYVALEDGSFSAANLFSALALLGQLTVCLSVFPVTIPIFIKGAVSRDRLAEFFARQEVFCYKQVSHVPDNRNRPPLLPDASVDKTTDEEDDEDEDNEPKYAQKRRQSEKLPEVAFSIENGSFAWPRTSASALRDVSLQVKSGTLTMVVGASGSGKTALVSALTEEMERLSGALRWRLPPSIALLGQRPWLMNASVRDNILLGRPMRAKRYRKVLEACDLGADVDLLPDGDETEVGERGVLLSGGQRQRLALARCLYSKAACTFLDAPFASLDAKITHHIFHRGVLGTLLKRRRTVFMTTDRTDFLEFADKVLVLSEGRIAAQGTVQEILREHPDLRPTLMKHKLPSRGQSLAAATEGRTAQERWRMLKNVTRLSIYMRQMQHKGRGDGGVGQNVSSIRQRAGSSSFNAHANKIGLLSKKKSVNALAISQLRMDSSSQLNLCHDILLPSDEVFDAASFGRASQKKSRNPVNRGRPNANTVDGPAGRIFSRALSWSTNITNSLNRGGTSQQHQQVVRRQTSRRQLRSVGSSSSMLVRHMAAAGVPRLSDRSEPNRHSSGSGGGGARTIFKRPPETREFHRMRSFHHALLSRRPFGGSSASLPKQSNSEPDSFSMEMPQFPFGLQQQQQQDQQSRSSSRQSSYSQDVFSTSSANQHHAIMRMTSNTSAISGFSDDFREDGDGEDDGLILSHEPVGAQERREYGEIGGSVYREYLSACGAGHAAAFLLVSVAMQALKVYMDFLLRDWSLATDGGGDGDEAVSVSYFYAYSMYSLGVLVLSCLANLLGQLIGARARRRVHARMLSNLVRCPLDLLESCPIGRVINRFSYDMFVVDQKLPSCVQRLVLVSLICASALAVNALQSPLFLLFAAPMVAAYWWLQHFYRASSRELQRLESLSRAPVLTYFSDTLGGLVTIRAFGEQQRFVNELCEKVDANTNTFLVLQSGCRWLGVALDFAGAAVVFASVSVNLAFHYSRDADADDSNPSRSSAASIGLSMNYSLLVPIYLAWVVKFVADIENYMNAVERILEYTDLAPEEDENASQDGEASAAADRLERWAESGGLELRFDTVGLAHSLDMRAVIQGLDLEVPAGQRVAIVGRSGSGKTTLLMGLSRVAKILYGRILLGGVDISRLPLGRLRRLVWTVSQDATLFSGTVRSNLDPERRLDDAQIRGALERLGVVGNWLAAPGDAAAAAAGLGAEVAEGGENLSHGRRQELALCRALLARPAALLLDESTSALDPAREAAAQRALLAALPAASTVVSVAHRLGGVVLLYDRVLVMGEGRVLEDGAPRELLRKPMGFFSALWRAAGEKPLS